MKECERYGCSRRIGDARLHQCAQCLRLKGRWPRG